MVVAPPHTQARRQHQRKKSASGRASERACLEEALVGVEEAVEDGGDVGRAVELGAADLHEGPQRLLFCWGGWGWMGWVRRWCEGGVLDWVGLSGRGRGGAVMRDVVVS